MHNIIYHECLLPSRLECDRPSITKVQISLSLRNYYRDSIMRIVGNLRAPTGTQGTSCFKPRGSPGSSPLRSDGSRDDQAGEAGPVEHSSAEAKSLKPEAKGLYGCHLSGQQLRQPEGRARGLLSRQFTKKHRA
jgi:hypothetical protein